MKPVHRDQRHDHQMDGREHLPRQQQAPAIEMQPVRDVADPRSVRRKPVVAGVIHEYHHAA